MTGRYAAIMNARRPAHNGDDFSVRHPTMPRGKRAKLFAAFDALSGYDEAIASQEVIYEAHAELGEALQEELDKKLRRLWEVWREAQYAGKYWGGSQGVPDCKLPSVTVTFFENAPGQQGQGNYRKVSGMVRKMDMSGKVLSLCSEQPPKQALLSIPFRDVANLSGSVFEESAM